MDNQNKGLSPKEDLDLILRAMKTHFEKGHIVEHVLVDLNVSRDTYYRWIKEYPQMKSMHEWGKSLRTANIYDTAVKATFGAIKNFNSNTFGMLARNIAGWDKKDAPSSSQINVENLQINQLTDTELNRQLLAKLKLHGLITQQEEDDTSSDE